MNKLFCKIHFIVLGPIRLRLVNVHQCFDSVNYLLFVVVWMLVGLKP